MSWWRNALGIDIPEPETFSIDAGSVEEAAAVSVPGEMIGGVGFYPAPVARVSRRLAMQVPAIRRALDLVGILGTLPIEVVKPDLTLAPKHWLQQPERDVPREVTMTRLVHDLALDGIAWWKVVAYDGFGPNAYPSEVVRLDPQTVDVLPDYRVRVTLAGRRGMSYEYPKDSELIRFEMPGNGWLTDGARAIRQCLLLDAAAQRYAEGAPPGDFFSPADGATGDEYTDEEITEHLDRWLLMRNKRSTGFVPNAWKYNNNPFNLEQLQLKDQRQHAVLELSRVTGIDAEELGVSTTSRTYSNQFDRRKQFTDFTLGMFRGSIEGRLRMGDVTTRGTEARFALSAFMRSDDKTRFEAYKLGKEVGAIGDDEVRPMEGKPPLAEPPAPPAPVVPAEPAQSTETEDVPA